MRLRILSILPAALLVVGITPAQGATNLLANSFFDASLNYWTAGATSYVTPSWSGANDAHGSTSSGSARLSDFDSQSESTWYWDGLYQCVPVAAGTAYQLNAWIGIPSGQSRTGKASVTVAYYNGSGCGGSQIGNNIWAKNSTADGYWHSVSSSSTAPSGAVSAGIYLNIEKDQAGGTFVVYYDEVIFSPSGSTGVCVADATHLCLTGNRFRVSVQWTDYNNNNVVAAAYAVPFAGETGFFYFKNSSNLELMVKVHNACINPYYTYWFFAAATTDVGYTITVTDTQTGQTEYYSNSPHHLSSAVTDQSSFETCP